MSAMILGREIRASAQPSPRGFGGQASDATTTMNDPLHDALFRHFGFREFLEGQEEVVRAVSEGQDALVVMPTGGGKSLCYQLPAMMLRRDYPGCFPADRVDEGPGGCSGCTGIRRRPSSTRRSGALPSSRQGMNDIRTAIYRLVYVAPERFESRSFLELPAPLPSRFSQSTKRIAFREWGHDFRPDYIRLKHVLEEIGRPQVLALTATATPEVRNDIVEQLGLGKGERLAPQDFRFRFCAPEPFAGSGQCLRQS